MANKKYSYEVKSFGTTMWQSAATIWEIKTNNPALLTGELIMDDPDEAIETIKAYIKANVKINNELAERVLSGFTVGYSMEELLRDNYDETIEDKYYDMQAMEVIKLIPDLEDIIDLMDQADIEYVKA